MRALLKSLRYQPWKLNRPCSSTTTRRSTSTSRIAYDYVDQVEELTWYEPGGYHPVGIGDHFRHRYRIVHKLGHGACSTIWLAQDLQRMKYVSLKIAIADWETSEADILSRLANSTKKLPSTLIPSLIECFSFEGPNGKHQCLVTEVARCSLAASKEASSIRLFPLQVARVLAAQLTIAVHQIHLQGYVHGDLHLGNILLKLPCGFNKLSEEQLYCQFGQPDPRPVVRQDGEPLPSKVPTHVYEAIWMGKPTEDLTLQDANLMLTDFGVAFRPSQEVRLKSHTPIDIRPPETRFEPRTPLTYSSDIWSLACTIWNFLAQRPMFGEILATPDMITSQQVNALGPLPRDWWDRWDKKLDFFTEDGTPIECLRSPSWDRYFEEDIQEPRRERIMGVLDAEEAKAFTAMLRSMLAYKPADRLTAKQVLQTEWMETYALPDYERSLAAGSSSARI
ncbi:protein kinase domain protein [Metarhizium acridum CQMa 102]|uniref:non-specific serine/threonine protein kinase n=1 Tax=Metarhizium acridum (strain CQMa 102) TaxID=655827 RepID=E9EH00_METAQ|nr:protein kinase domain protein [Metarhizium acridum CQMa 102]EFY84826.1 protein kinase domain protein [Metarhizium acridum CQMa 102]